MNGAGGSEDLSTRPSGAPALPPPRASPRLGDPSPDPGARARTGRGRPSGHTGVCTPAVSAAAPAAARGDREEQAVAPAVARTPAARGPGTEAPSHGPGRCVLGAPEDAPGTRTRPRGRSLRYRGPDPSRCRPSGGSASAPCRLTAAPGAPGRPSALSAVPRPSRSTSAPSVNPRPYRRHSAISAATRLSSSSIPTVQRSSVLSVTVRPFPSTVGAPRCPSTLRVRAQRFRHRVRDARVSAAPRLGAWTRGPPSTPPAVQGPPALREAARSPGCPALSLAGVRGAGPPRGPTGHSARASRRSWIDAPVFSVRLLSVRCAWKSVPCADNTTLYFLLLDSYFCFRFPRWSGRHCCVCVSKV